MDKRAVLETWFQRFWCDEDLSAIDDMVESDTDIRGLTDAPKVDPDGLLDFAKAMLGLVSFSHVTIDKFMEMGDWGHALTTFHAIGRDSGIEVPFTVQVLVKIEADKITDAHNHPDFFTLYQKLGLLPSDAMERCLSGRGFT